jgi:hypothetical protein
VQRKLNILILTQALEDLLAQELGGTLSEEDLWTAETYLSAYPNVFKKILKKEDLGGWLRSVRAAKEGLAAAQQERRRKRGITT